MHIWQYKFLQQPIYEAKQIGQNLHITRGKNTIYTIFLKIKFGYM